VSSLKKRFKPRLLIVYVLVGVVIYFARPSPLSLVLGLIPICGGEALRLWATGHLHKNDALTVTGPYAYLRNPLYLGTLLIGTGFALIASTPLAYAVLALFALVYFVYYMPYKDRIETARLEELYGDSFRRYAVAVPSLVPRLHPYVPLGADSSPAPEWSVRFQDNNELGTAVAVVTVVALLTARWILV
jgi:protein-S-isoprenylcysteine O-methyltransferase Ste14